jgi:hypothetical protein
MEEFFDCLHLADEILEGKYSSLFDATHYHLYNLTPPSWTKDPRVKKIGRIQVGKDKKGNPILSKHIFYIES